MLYIICQSIQNTISDLIIHSETMSHPKEPNRIDRAMSRMAKFKLHPLRKQNAICSKLFPPNIWSMVHHKTGHDFSWSLSITLQKFCHQRTQPLRTGLSMNQFLASCKPQSCAYLHWVRHPLNTIISGYHYHLKTDEDWVRDAFIAQSHSTAIGMKTPLLFLDILNNTVNASDFYTKYRRQEGIVRVSSGKRRDDSMPLMNCFDTVPDSLLYAYINRFVENEIMRHSMYMLDANVTLQRFYRRLHGINYKIGLFWEFVRYFNCEWASIYVLQQIGDRYYRNAAEYDIDEFMNGHFDENVNKILNQINFVDNAQNRRQLKDQNVSIAKKRVTLLELLKDLDVSMDNKTDKHITHNEYNFEIVTRDLLSLDVEICKLIKNMTILLKFEWHHAEYC